MNTSTCCQPDYREVLDALPVYPVSRLGQVPESVCLDGLVVSPLEFTARALQRLPQQELIEDFHCQEGWTVRGVRWQGVVLDTILKLAEVHSQARWVQASAGEFSVPIPLREARRALLATRLADGELPVEHGGPVRLVLPGGDCWTSVKWLDRLELRAQPGENTGKAIVLGRLWALAVAEK